MLSLPRGIPVQGFVFHEGKVLFLSNYYTELYLNDKDSLEIEGILVSSLTLGRNGIHMGYCIQVPPSVKVNLGFTFLCAYRDHANSVNQLEGFKLRYRMESMRVFSAQGYTLFTSEYPNKIRTRLESE